MVRRWRTMATLAVVASLLLSGCIPSGPYRQPERQLLTITEECPAGARVARNVQFGPNRQTNLKGLVYGAGTVGIVLVNGFTTLQCAWTPVATALAGRGYRVLTFDFNDFGSSSASHTDVDHDVTAAVAFLRADGATSVVLVGDEMGGTAAVVAAADITPAVRGVVSLSGPPSFSLISMSGVAAAPRLAVPVLYVVGDADGLALAGVRTLYDATPTDKRSLTIVPGQQQGIALLLYDQKPGSPLLDGFLAEHAPTA